MAESGGEVRFLLRNTLILFIVVSVISAFYSCDVTLLEPDRSESVQLSKTINLHKTDIIATSNDNILRLVGDSLLFSNDLGKTWKKMKNTIGTITFVHFFSNQTCLICGRYDAFWTDYSFEKLTQSILYDYDGKEITEKTPHFFQALQGHKYDYLIDGKSTLIWSDYLGETEGYVSRVWATDDYGKTLRCICKNKETIASSGEVISCRHFHDCIYREGYNELYITTGDFNNQCHLIKGVRKKDGWSFHIINRGPLFKFDGMWIEEPFLYVLTDYTGYGNTGLLKVHFEQLHDISSYTYLVKDTNNRPLTRLYKFNNYRFLAYDGSIKGRLLMSVNNGEFEELTIMFDGDSGYSSNFITAPNNSGLCLMRRGNRKGNYDITDLHLNDQMYVFTEAMHRAGYLDFAR